MNCTSVDAVDLGRLCPAKGRIFEISPDHDGALGNLEMAVDQVNSKDFLSVVADEQSRKIRNMLVCDRRLIAVIEKSIVPTGR